MSGKPRRWRGSAFQKAIYVEVQRATNHQRTMQQAALAIEALALDRSAAPALLAERDRLREALEPFAKAVELEGDPDSYSLWEHPVATDLTIGDLRRAAQALTGKAEG